MKNFMMEKFAVKTPNADYVGYLQSLLVDATIQSIHIRATYNNHDNVTNPFFYIGYSGYDGRPNCKFSDIGISAFICICMYISQ